MSPIAASTLSIVVTKYARARSSSRKRVSRYSNIVSTQRPPIEIRRQIGRRFGRAALRRSGRRRAGRPARRPWRPRTAPRRKSRRRGRVLAVLVVEAQQGLDQAEADDDAGGDDGGEHHLGGAVVGRWSGSACRAAAARPRSASRRCSPPCRRRRSSLGGGGIPTRADPTLVRGRERGRRGQKDPGDRVLEEAGIGHRVDQEGCEGRKKLLGLWVAARGSCRGGEACGRATVRPRPASRATRARDGCGTAGRRPAAIVHRAVRTRAV